jgi:hypothetical protein
MPQPFLGFLPSECSPRWRSLTPLEAAWLPCSYPPTCWNVRLSIFYRWFLRLPRFRAVAWFPRRLWAPFSLVKRAFRLPWISCRGTAPFRPLHLLRSFTPSCESVRDWIGFPLTCRSLLSWDSAPLELSPPTPWILDPSRPEGLNTNSCLPARDSKDRSPSCQVRSSRFPKVSVRPLDGFQPP